MHNNMPIKHLNTTINTKINCKLLWQDAISLKAAFSGIFCMGNIMQSIVNCSNQK